MEMVTVGDIYGLLNVCAPSETAMSFDNVGFFVEEREAFISAVLLALDITPDVVGEVVRLRTELIISHHPAIFQPLRRMGPQDVLYLLARHGIRAICTHTNLGLAPSGVNTCLAEALGLGDIHRVKLCGTNGLWKGFIGSLPRRNSPAEFVEYVKQALNCGGPRYMDRGKPVRIVALYGSTGADLLEDAMQAGANVFITAGTKYHQLLLARQFGITLVDASHFGTEDVAVLPLKENLQEQSPTVHFQKSEVLCDPAQYL